MITWTLPVYVHSKIKIENENWIFENHLPKVRLVGNIFDFLLLGTNGPNEFECSYQFRLVGTYFGTAKYILVILLHDKYSKYSPSDVLSKL